MGGSTRPPSPRRSSGWFDPLTPGEVRPRGSQGVALSGKAQRGRLRHAATPTHPIHAVTAFCHDLGGVLAQLVVDAQQHEAELTVAPEAIRQIGWQGRVLRGDALYCQQALCAQVVEAGGDYVLIVKENQPTLLADIAQVFTPLTAEEVARTGVHTLQPLTMQTYRTVEKGHGRLAHVTSARDSLLQLHSIGEHTTRYRKLCPGVPS
ncbi:MAG TPA: ISAs1 family transposase [Roseiflexaceae bacterium]